MWRQRRGRVWATSVQLAAPGPWGLGRALPQKVVLKVRFAWKTAAREGVLALPTPAMVER